MNFKKIPINKSSYIKLYEDDTFEVHCSAQGPLGANVYHFKKGLLKWKHRRSYIFVSKKYKVIYEQFKQPNTLTNNKSKKNL